MWKTVSSVGMLACGAASLLLASPLAFHGVWDMKYAMYGGICVGVGAMFLAFNV